MTMRRTIGPLCPLLLLAACVYQDAVDPARFGPLSEDPQQPALALLEHALTGYFAQAGAAAPTTCAALDPKALTPEQEEALIVRLVRVAPGARCVTREDRLVDSITGEPAQRVQVYDFACAEPDRCRGWVARPDAPATHYTLRFEDGAWHFDSDPRQTGT